MLGITIIDRAFELIGIISSAYVLAHWYFHKKLAYAKAKRKRLPRVRKP